MINRLGNFFKLAEEPKLQSHLESILKIRLTTIKLRIQVLKALFVKLEEDLKFLQSHLLDE